MTLETREIVSVDVAAPVADVWAHLRDPRLVRRWFGWDHPDLDAEIRQIFVDGPREHHAHADGRTTRALTWPHHDVLTVTARDDEPRRTHVTITRRSHDGLAPSTVSTTRSTRAGSRSCSSCGSRSSTTRGRTA
ncbi:SRPBCC family protein [Cellulomonas sp. JZ18]|uniref:SRPBCC family protein n=1 Tax=Cellulomonas sp. JZ18 TaxID=2654191 RepID=UPI001E307CC2|nr:SRPBCC family protein [Cellulomonas sp. JZ18]